MTVFTSFKKFTLLASTALILAACDGGKPAQTAQQPAENKPAASAPVAASTPAATQNTSAGSLIDRINNKGTITIGTEGTYAPFTYHDKDGKLTGYDVEVARAAAAKLGVTVEFKETQWDAMLAGLKSDRFDIVANQVGLTSPERQATFDKSEPYSWSGAALLGRQDDTRISKLEDIKGLKNAQTLTSNYGEMATKAGAEIVPVDGMAQAIELVKQNRADFTLNAELSLLDYLKKNPDSGLKILWESPKESKVGAGFIFNKGNDEAVKKFSEAVLELKKDGTLTKLGQEFFGKDVSEQ